MMDICAKIILLIGTCFILTKAMESKKFNLIWLQTEILTKLN